jgi:hypothetical protein
MIRTTKNDSKSVLVTSMITAAETLNFIDPDVEGQPTR